MDDLRVARINELARKAKAEGLNDDEILEQRHLRAEYLREIREATIATLENTVIVRPDGSREPMKKKET
jgi:uncharacterized protein YnzC (UPF0291/DUF896 family)